MMKYRFNRTITALALPLVTVLAINAGNNPFSPNPVREFFWIQNILSSLFILLFLLKIIKYRAFEINDNKLVINGLWTGKKHVNYDDIKSMDFNNIPNYFSLTLKSGEKIKFYSNDLRRTDIEQIRNLFNGNLISTNNGESSSTGS